MRLPDTGEVLRPKFAVRKDAVRNPHPNNAASKPTNGNNPETSPWQLLVDIHPPHEPLDRVTRSKAGTDASPHGRMERLLRGTGAPAGLLCNGTTLRLVSAPKGESSGWLDFRVADMVQTAGRPIAATGTTQTIRESLFPIRPSISDPFVPSWFEFAKTPISPAARLRQTQPSLPGSSH